jgi:hypothetical protein
VALSQVTRVIGQGTGFETFLGDDLLGWLTLAIGGALAVGTLLALVRPPTTRADGAQADGAQADGTGADGTLARPPLGRSLVMIAVGLVAAIWGLASLMTG